MTSFQKTAYYDLFSKNNLFKTAYLYKTAYYDLFSKKSLFKTTYLYKNNLLRSLFQKQLIYTKQLIYAKQLVTIVINCFV